MKIEQILKGKKYYQVRDKAVRRSSKRRVTIEVIYVLDVNRQKSEVLASTNGTAPKWVKSQYYKHWEEKERATA